MFDRIKKATTFTWRVETLVLISCIFFTLISNNSFWMALAAGLDVSNAHNWVVFVLLGVMITALHAFLFLLVMNRWTVKPLLILLFLSSASAVYFMNKYHIYLDAAMLRNLIETDTKEAADLVHLDLVVALFLLGVIPSILVYRANIILLPLKRAILIRMLSLIVLLIVSIVCGWAVMNDLAPTMRQNKSMRYLITPSNYLYSLGSALHSYKKTAVTVKQPIAEDARQVTDSKRKPRAFIVFVGETQRAANWGLNGYERQTTPLLSKQTIMNFNDATSCGTDTAQSVPCMFSVYGRHKYNENKIRTSESLLNVLNRTGVSVMWFDNQSGCKGVCDNVPNEDVTKSKNPDFCVKGDCFDEILINKMKDQLDASKGDVLIVLHMMGSHGPAYFKRYPPEFRKWEPTCDSGDIATCNRDQIVNTYDNTILYADYVLSKAIDTLATNNTHDTVLWFMSDHGESLGENNMYLHGFPYAIAPDMQKKIPMITWFSPTFAKSIGLNEACFAKRQHDAVSHDNLFPTVLSVFDIQTTAYDASFDLFASCKQ
jgi:lipid A ethanolaminephosphotransferase